MNTELCSRRDAINSRLQPHVPRSQDVQMATATTSVSFGTRQILTIKKNNGYGSGGAVVLQGRAHDWNSSAKYLFRL